MATTRVPAIDYTSRDRDSILSDMIRAIPLYTSEWTDHNTSDLGIVLLTLLSGKLDGLHFYVDRMAAEAFITTAVKRESVIKILRLVNYELRSVVPATTSVTFSISTALTDNVVIPLGTQVQTVASQSQEPVVFETTAAVTITAGALTATVDVAEGITDDEPLGDSTGQAFQGFPIDSSIIIDDSLQIFVDEGAGEVLWTKVTSFVNSAPTDTHYRVERDANDLVTIFFGDNLQGKIPVGTSPVRAAFRLIQGTRAGVFGNVGAGSISIVNTSVFVGGRKVNLGVTNPAQASAGEDRQSIEEAKRLGPASVTTQQRVVTSADYKNEMEQFGGIAKALAVQGVGDDPCFACNLDLYVAPTGGGFASTTLKAALLLHLDSLKMVGTGLVVKDPTYVSIDISGTVFNESNVDRQTVEDDFNAAVDAFFDINSSVYMDFGSDLFLANLFSALGEVDGVSHINFTKVTRVPVASLDIWNGDPTFGTIVPGTTSVEETWTVTFISATTFSVQGSVSGLSTDGVLGTAYVSDGLQVAFTVTAGTTAPSVGDKATFKTSPAFGNVTITSQEVLQKGTVTLTFSTVGTESSAC